MTDQPAPVLGRAVTGTLDASDIDLMPTAGPVEYVDVSTDELQAVCPVTGAPDIYQASITYEPDGRVFESKALAMYLRRWRLVGITCEDLACTIAQELTDRIGREVTAHLTQNVRGGLRITASATGTTTTPAP
jgi:NADPH-dependent 7-cyano-7-deazaguanine reductase QueF